LDRFVLWPGEESTLPEILQTLIPEILVFLKSNVVGSTLVAILSNKLSNAVGVAGF
jgi:hypothetical protein